MLTRRVGSPRSVLSRRALADRGLDASLAVAKEAGAATTNYGVFINTVLDFVIVAFAIFLVVRAVNRLKRKEEAAPPPDAAAAPTA
jgi:large conductance mechanosensitive channel